MKIEVDYDLSAGVPIQRVDAIRCPYCGRGDFRNYGTHGNVLYCQCRSCVHMGTGAATRFKVRIVEPRN